MSNNKIPGIGTARQGYTVGSSVLPKSNSAGKWDSKSYIKEISSKIQEFGNYSNKEIRQHWNRMSSWK